MEENRSKLIPSLVYFLYILTFLPVLIWLFQSTAKEDQLTNAFIMTALVSVFLYMDQKIHLHFTFVFSKICQTALIICFVLIAITIIFNVSSLINTVLIVSSLSVFLYSLLHYLFGEENKIFLNAIVVAFTAFIIFTLVQPILDIPLRYYAGRTSSLVLELLGLHNQLFLVLNDQPNFVLQVKGENYLVAPECNGFGVISSSFLIGLLISFYYKISLLKKSLFIFGSALIGFALNALRIIIIILLAPHVGQYYDLVHEIVGMITFIVAIGLILFLSIKFFKSPSRQPHLNEG